MVDNAIVSVNVDGYGVAAAANAEVVVAKVVMERWRCKCAGDVFGCSGATSGAGADSVIRCGVGGGRGASDLHL